MSLKRRWRVYSVRERSGEWHYRAYRVDEDGEYWKQKPPVRLEKRFAGTVMASTSGRATRAVMEAESLAAEPPKP